jgi:hypothetical protein
MPIARRMMLFFGSKPTAGLATPTEIDSLAACRPPGVFTANTGAPRLYTYTNGVEQHRLARWPDPIGDI